MQKKILTVLAVVGVLMSGCASQPATSFDAVQTTDLNTLVSSGQYEQKVDNFFVINDSSSSMTEKFKNIGFSGQPAPTKFSVEKEILGRINKTMPDLNLTTGIRSFGFGKCLSWGTSKVNLPATKYSKAAFNGGIDALDCASGGSPLNKGIRGTTEDMKGSSGNIAVLILSDGHELESDGVKAMKSLKQYYGDRLCVYSVWVGNPGEDYGRTVLNQLSYIAGCGYNTTAEKIASPQGMGDFVKSIFLKPAPDSCDKHDTDRDGVNDCLDKCPNTPTGAHVNQFGCWIVDIKFDNDKSDIKPLYFQELDEVANAIKSHPGIRIEVQGHTSNTGSEEHNLGLSDRRAEAVKAYLSRATGSTAVSAHGYGMTQPIDTNETEEGRANNRRVQLEMIH